MDFIIKVLIAAKASSNHHKIPLDVLDHLDKPWRDMFLKYWKKYLEGARAPDKTFHDFKNHVLHVRENYWGGAISAANLWYGKFVNNLRDSNWKEAAYSCGVMTHYVADPMQPLHTGQVEEEGRIHKWYEWAILKSYGELQEIINSTGGYPEIDIPEGNDWLEKLIKREATQSNKSYELIIERFRVNKKNPAAGLDNVLKEDIAKIVGRTVMSLALVIKKAINEANIEPPKYNMTLMKLLVSISIPLFWIQKNLHEKKDKKQLMAMEDEYERTGKVEDNLPADDKMVKELHAKEVLGNKTEIKNDEKIVKESKYKAYNKDYNQKTKKIGNKETKKENHKVDQLKHKNQKTVKKQSKLRFYLELNDPIDDAPEIGKKTAKKLIKAGVNNIEELINADPDSIVKKIGDSRITAETFRRWQKEATLAYQIPKIRGHDVQILVNCGFDTVDKIKIMKPSDLLEKITPFVESSDGQRILRSGKKPDLDEVTDWIEWAKSARH